MDGKTWTVLFLIFSPVLIEAWKASREDRKDTKEVLDKRETRRHYHTKRHMQEENEIKPKRVTTQKPREQRKKPSGHLAPLEEDDIDNDEVISVAIGPPPIRPKYDKVHWKHPPRPTGSPNVTNNTFATDLVKDILSQLGRELILRQVSEDFIFGQYVSSTIKNMSSEIKVKMQHEILGVIVKFQKLNIGDVLKPTEESSTAPNSLVATVINNSIKDLKTEKKYMQNNETEDTWPDFTNLAKIVG